MIESINRDLYPSKEVLVIDGGSTDETIEYAKKKGAKVLMEEGVKCPANARNQGAKNSRAEVLCFLDGDVERVGKEFITHAMTHFNDSVVGVKCNRITLAETTVEKILEVSRRSWAARFFKRIQSSEYSHANFIRRDVFESIGGFPLLGYGEDRIFWRKLKGYMERNPDKRIADESQSKFYQHRGSSLTGLFKEHTWYGRTVIPYIQLANPRVWEIIPISIIPAYIFSMLSILLIPFSVWFALLAFPYFVRFSMAILSGVKQRSWYYFAIPLVDAARSIGFIKGLTQYLIGERRLSRG